MAIASSYLSDKYSRRGLTIIMFALLGLTGFAIFLGASESHHLSFFHCTNRRSVGSHHPHARYASLFLILPGTYAMAPPLAAWILNNSHFPYTTRATSIALLGISTNSAGIFSTWLLGSWSKPPGYVAAAWVLGMFQLGIALCASACWVWLWRENKVQGRKYIL